jgi:hypothetical protein
MPIARTTNALALALVIILILSGLAWFGHETGVAQETRLASLRKQEAELRTEVRRLRTKGEAEQRTRQAALNPAAGDSLDLKLEGEVRAMLGRISALQERLARSPEQRIPELRFLSERDWLDVAQRNGRLETDEDFRRALSDLRMKAVTELPVGKALTAYLKNSQGQLPATVAELAPYFDPPLDASVLDRYEMRKSGTAPPDQVVDYNSALIGEKRSALPDPIYDDDVLFTTNGIVTMHNFDVPAIMAAYKAYADANNGQHPATAEQALPYFQDPATGAVFLEVAKAHHVYGEP